jgi:hypothetical protein
MMSMVLQWLSIAKAGLPHPAVPAAAQLHQNNGICLKPCL